MKIRLGMVGGGIGAFIGDVHRMAARLPGAKSATTFSQIFRHCNRFESLRDASVGFAPMAGLNPAETGQKRAVFSHALPLTAQA